MYPSTLHPQPKPAEQKNQRAHYASGLRSSLKAGLLIVLLQAACAPSLMAATIIITDLEDVEFGELPPTAVRVQQRISFCVNSDPAGPFRVTALGSGPSVTDFAISNEAGEVIPYSVYVARQRNRLGRALQPGVPSDPLQARRLGRDGRCRPPRVWLTVLIEDTDIQGAPGGRYAGTLQITVAPE